MTLLNPNGLDLLTAEDSAPAARYTQAMLARAIGVSDSAVRRWTRRGYLLPEQDSLGLPAYGFVEARVARVLASMDAAGLSLDQIDRVVDRLHESAPADCRPLAEWDIRPSGESAVVRSGDQARDPAGQLLMEFEPSDTAADHEPHAVVLPLCRPSDFDGPLPFDPDALRDDANLALEEGDPLLAEQMLRSLLLSGEGEPIDHLTLGECLFQLGDLPGARERYSMCLELDPDCLAARLNLGVLYSELGEWELAAGALEGVLAHSPHCVDALVPLAEACERLGHLEKAEELRERVRSLDPSELWDEQEAGAHAVENPSGSPILQGS